MSPPSSASSTARVRGPTSASVATSSGWRTRKSAAAVENPNSRAATGSTSGRVSCSRATGSSPTREMATRASSGSGASASVRPSTSGVNTPAS